MKTINKIQLFAVTVLAATALLLTGCAKEKGCTDSAATNFKSEAEEDDGSCTYIPDKVAGTWTFNETCNQSITASYTVQITAIEGSKNSIKISNFRNNPNINIIATYPPEFLEGNSVEFSCNNQTFNVNGGFVNINDGYIYFPDYNSISANMGYGFSDGTSSYFCSISASKVQ